MRTGALIRAAIEVLDEILNRHRPAATALVRLGQEPPLRRLRRPLGDRQPRLRRAAPPPVAGGADGERHPARPGAGRRIAGSGPGAVEAVIAGADGSPHALEPLSEAEQAGLCAHLPPDTPASTSLGDIPDWLAPSFQRAFGAAAAEEGAALAKRAPVDVRANALKADRERVLKALARFSAEPTRFSPIGVRLPAPEGAGPPAQRRGRDRSRQRLVRGAGRGLPDRGADGQRRAPRNRCSTFARAAGGKTLAIAAAMRNTGQIYAYDDDAGAPAADLRAAEAGRRAQRPGADRRRHRPRSRRSARDSISCFIDASCTGTGAWRRRPDAKWRLKPANLAQRQAEQQAVLELGAPLVKPGGRLVYVTCSVLPEENGDQIVGASGEPSAVCDVTVA